jgi:hypothetical protein
LTSIYTEPRPSPWPAFLPVARGLVGAALGFAVGVGLAALGRTAAGASAFEIEQSSVIGYVFALVGWLLGVGVWDRWAREWFGMRAKDGPSGWQRYLGLYR